VRTNTERLMKRILELPPTWERDLAALETALGLTYLDQDKGVRAYDDADSNEVTVHLGGDVVEAVEIDIEDFEGDELEQDAAYEQLLARFEAHAKGLESIVGSPEYVGETNAEEAPYEFDADSQHCAVWPLPNVLVVLHAFDSQGWQAPWILAVHLHPSDTVE
jgi:hypothetical protein